MKLKEYMGKVLDLTKEKEPSVYEEIAYKFGKRIKIMKDTKKDQHSAVVNFKVFEKIKEQAEQIANKSKLFKKPADVHRAAYYLGLNILYHLVMKEDAEYEDKIIHESLMMVEAVNFRLQTIDSFITTFYGLVEKMKKGMTSEEEVLENCESVLKHFPPEQRKYVHDQMKKLMQGEEKLAQLLSRRIQGQHIALRAVK